MNIVENVKNNIKTLIIAVVVLIAVVLGGSFVMKNLDAINHLYFFRTNLFDFIIFASIIALICKKLDLGQKFEQAKSNVEATINESSSAKEVSEEKLHTIEESLAHVGEEIDLIIKKSEENANLVGEKILADAEKNTSAINDNTDKAIENSEHILRNDLIKRASLASVEVARNHIINELKNNLDLHNKLIDESLGAIEGVELK